MTPITEQIEQMEAVASRHFPDDEARRNGYLVEKLKERLREYAAMFQRLPVREMKVTEYCRFPDCRCPLDPGPEPDWCARGLPHAERSK